METRRELSVADVTEKTPPIIPWHLTVGAARKIAELKSTMILLVEEERRVVGVIDRRTLDTAGDADPVTACMRSLLLCAQPNTTARRARELMVKHRLPALPVAAGMFVLGSVTREAIERAMAGTSPRARRVPGMRRNPADVAAA